MKALAEAVSRLHDSPVLHLQTVPVALDQGGAFWQGDVEVFALLNGSEARKCFAWANSCAEAVVVMATPRITSADDAVRSHYSNACAAA